MNQGYYPVLGALDEVSNFDFAFQSCTATIAMGTESCPSDELIPSIVYTIVCIPLECIVVYAFMKFIAKRIEIVAEMNKFSTRLTIAILTSTFLWIICHDITKWIGQCFNLESSVSYIIFSSLATALYAIQSFILLIIFFERLDIVFNGTSFVVSKCTKNIYKFLFISTPILVVIAICLFQYTLIFSILAGVVLLLFIGLMISLVILFIIKLVNVYKSSGMSENTGADKSVVSAITKTTILTTISVSMTLVNAIVAIWRLNTDNIYIIWFQNYFVLLDVYTNFLCVILSYTAFVKYYQTLCKCMDIKCRSCWVRIIYAGSCCDKQLMEKMVINIDDGDAELNIASSTSEHELCTMDDGIGTDQQLEIANVDSKT